MSKLVATLQIPYALIGLTVARGVGVMFEVVADVTRLAKIDDRRQWWLEMALREGITPREKWREVC